LLGFWLEERDFFSIFLAEVFGVAAGIFVTLATVERVVSYRDRLLRPRVRDLIRGRFEREMRVQLRSLSQVYSTAMGLLGVDAKVGWMTNRPFVTNEIREEAWKLTQAGFIREEDLREAHYPLFVEILAPAIQRFDKAWHEIAADLLPLLVSARDFPVINEAAFAESHLRTLKGYLKEEQGNPDANVGPVIYARNLLNNLALLIERLSALVDAIHGSSDYLEIS